MYVPPELTSHAASKVDTAIILAATQLGYPGILNDGITLRRFRLPARERGCSMRSRRLLAPIAYAASFVRAAERFPDSTDAAGTVVPGFFPMLTSVFGDGAFAAGGHRFRDFVAPALRLGPRPPLPTALALVAAWTELRARVAGSDVRGALDDDVSRAGERVGGKLQHAITNHVERHERGRLHSIITALADDDPRKVAWLSIHQQPLGVVVADT